jgi:hypothetical protein
MEYRKQNYCRINRNREQKSQITGLRHSIYNNAGGIYIGEWLNNKKDGYGELQQTNGLIYKGMWKSDKRHGCGITLRKTFQGLITVYDGEYLHGKKHGEGRKFYNNGVYQGRWENDEKVFGIMEYNDGKTYMGEWCNDKCDGLGLLLYNDGCRYEGYWKNGKKHGEGTFYHKQTGQVQKGVWYAGVCKTSMIQDVDRQQCQMPTVYGIPTLMIKDPTEVVRQCFQSLLETIRNKQ